MCISFRWPGASLIIIRGHKHLHECAYIGDDSSEELDELMENIREQALPRENYENSPPNKPGQMTRHRPWVEFHNPDHEKLENHTLDHEQDVEDHNTDPKIMNNILIQLRQSLMKKEKEKQNENVHRHRDHTINQDEKEFLTIRDPNGVEDSEEIFRSVLGKLQKLGSKGKEVLVKLNEQMGSNHNVNDLKVELEHIMIKPGEQPFVETKGRTWTKPQVHYEDMIDEANRKKRDLVIETALKDRLIENVNSAEDAAVEEVSLTFCPIIF